MLKIIPFIICISLLSQAQNIRITGVVRDSAGDGIGNTTITLLTHHISTSTNVNDTFILTDNPAEITKHHKFEESTAKFIFDLSSSA